MKKKLRLVCLVLLIIQLLGFTGMIHYSHQNWFRYLVYLHLREVMLVWFGGLMVLTLLVFLKVKEKPEQKDISAVVILILLSVFSLAVVYGRSIIGLP